MKVKDAKAKTEVPLDLVLFAATVPARPQTPKDLQDVKAHEDDAIEPKEYETMEESAEDL